jgi:hypothetical protein
MTWIQNNVLIATQLSLSLTSGIITKGVSNRYAKRAALSE